MVHRKLHEPVGTTLKACEGRISPCAFKVAAESELAQFQIQVWCIDLTPFLVQIKPEEFNHRGPLVCEVPVCSAAAPVRHDDGDLGTVLHAPEELIEEMDSLIRLQVLHKVARVSLFDGVVLKRERFTAHVENVIHALEGDDINTFEPFPLVLSTAKIDLHHQHKPLSLSQ